METLKGLRATQGPHCRIAVHRRAGWARGTSTLREKTILSILPPTSAPGIQLHASRKALLDDRKAATMTQGEGAQIIDGKAIAKSIHIEVQQEVQRFKELHNRVW